MENKVWKKNRRNSSWIKRYGKYGRKNAKLNSGKIQISWKILKKSKLNSEKIWKKIWKKDLENTENSDKIGKYGRKK